MPGHRRSAAAALPEIVARLHDLGMDVPIVGDFHYNGHLLLTKFPATARALDKYRINPGNVGGKRRDENFRAIVRIAVEHDKPVRIGVNWGSLDQDLLTSMMDANARLAEPRDFKDVYVEAMLESALRSAALAEDVGLGHDRILISAKVSQVQDLVTVYRRLAARCEEKRCTHFDGTRCMLEDLSGQGTVVAGRPMPRGEPSHALASA